jgi:hypothetical protein
MIHEGRKFCFVHIPKNGGTSLKKTLGLRLYGEHFTALDYKNSYTHIWNDLFKFSFVRNPWDRVASIYHFYKFNRVERVNRHIHNQVPNDFNVFVRSLFSTAPPKWTLGVYSHPYKKIQKNWVTDMDGEIIVDHIARFENYNDEVNYISNQIGVKNPTIYHLRKSGQRDKDYRTLYSDDTAELVSIHLKDDIDFFKYEF